jgi:hypothetical protein
MVAGTDNPWTGQSGNGIPVGKTGFDYTYLVANTGTVPINGFVFSVGVANNVPALTTFNTNSFKALYRCFR